MRAAVLTAYGPPEVLAVREVPPPPLTRPTQVRVQIHASSVNPIDAKIRAGLQRAVVRYTLPRALGLDLSGVVVEVGSQVTRFRVGDAVWGSPSHRAPGCYAEQTVVEAAELAHKPARLSHIEAATLPLVGLTAWACLMPRLAERPGQRVLVTAGSGGVGTVALQLARAHGAWIATTCSGRNAELVRSLGADQVIDYTTTPFPTAVAELDLVLDALGGSDTLAALSCTRRGGRLASIVSGMAAYTAQHGPLLGAVRTGVGVLGLMARGAWRGVEARAVVRRPDGAALEALGALVEAGAIRPVVEQVYPLDQIARAHAHLETGRVRGKLGIEVRPD